MPSFRRMPRALAHELNVIRSWFERRDMRRRFDGWAELEAAATENASCAACGYSRALQLHLIRPAGLAGARAFEKSNLLVLCMGPNECHLRIGHGGRWA